MARDPTAAVGRTGVTMARLLLILAAGLVLAGCALLAPPLAPTSLADRLAALPAEGLPLARPVTIHWNDHQVPFIEAETDRDLALALGVVHAHLRLGQMEILRRIAHGRVAELGGPLATDIDHGLRILDFPRAAAATVAAMPAATRAWVEAYNHVLERAPALPHEFRVLDLARAVRGAGQVLDVEFHQTLSGKADHLAQQIGVGALLQQGTKVHHLVGHRRVLGSC